MRTRAWRRDEVIRGIRDRIWLYLSPAVGPADLLLEAAALLQLPEQDVLALAQVYFLLSDEVGDLLAAVPQLLRRLPTDVAQVEERTTDRIRGAVRWQATVLARFETGLPHLYVTAPTERAFDTPENRLLVFMLREIVSLAVETGWDAASGETGRIVAQRYSEAVRLLGSRMLRGIESTQPMPRSVACVRTGRHRRPFAPVLSAFDRYQALIAHLDRDQVRAIVESRGLTIQSDGTLFEVHCVFAVIDALQTLGWLMPPLRVFRGGLHCLASGSAGRLDLWYQVVPAQISVDSAYTAALRAHGFEGPVDLRPDVVLRLTRGGQERWLIVEAKMGTTREVGASARRALADLLGYRTAFAAVLSGAAPPYGLGLAWGAELKPVPHPVMLCTPEHIGQALGYFLESV